LQVLRWDGRERITLGRDFHREPQTNFQETLRLLENEQDWIEKYRAALVQLPPSRRMRLAAALNSLAKTLGFAMGKTSSKLGHSAQNTVVSSQSPERAVQERPQTQGHPREQIAGKKSPPPEHRQDKKAS
jgi:hypothetical protein